MSVKFRLVKRKVLLGEDAGKEKMYAYAKKTNTTDVAKLGKLVGHAPVFRRLISRV